MPGPFPVHRDNLPPTAWAANPSHDLRDAGAAVLCLEPAPHQAHPERPAARLSSHPGLL